MSSVTTVLRWSDLRPRQASAIKRKGRHLGVTPESYVKELILHDLQLDRLAENSTFDELAKPFRAAWNGVPEEELDAAISAAKADFRKRDIKRKH